jgi:hypothetical protein
MDYDGELGTLPHKCHYCNSQDVSHHCFSPRCSWVRCNICGSVTGFIRIEDRMVLGSFRNVV